MPKLAGLIVLMLLVVHTSSSNAKAKDFGVHGETFEIEEKDMLELIHDRLNKLEKNGDLEKHYKSLRDNASRYVERPEAVKNLNNARLRRTWDFDPSYRLPKDILDHKGFVIHKAGTTVNPLDSVPLDYNLLFIDGDNEEHLKLAITTHKSATKPLKIILIKGSPMELMKSNKMRFYFDQKGTLTGRLGIKHVPAFVEQNEKVLKISEIVVANAN